MTSDGSNRLFEVGDGPGAEPFEADGLGQRTDFQSRASRAGADFKEMAIRRVTEAGGTIERLAFEIDGFPVDALVHGENGRQFLVLARGTPDEHGRSGLRRPDTVEKVGFMAIQLARRQDLPILIITSDLPDRSTRTGHYLAALSPDVWDIVAYRDDFRGFQRLRTALHDFAPPSPPPAPWRGPVVSNESSMFEEEADASPQHTRRPAVNDDETHQ